MEITFESVRNIIVDTLSCDAEDVRPDTNLIEDLEADSLEIVELSMALKGLSQNRNFLPVLQQSSKKSPGNLPELQVSGTF